MRRSAFPLILATAVLIAGSAGFVRPVGATSCAGFAAPLASRVTQADVIVIGSVRTAGPDSSTVAPEAFLRGPTRPDTLTLTKPARDPECPLAELTAGSRVLLLLNTSSDAYGWPDASLAYVLKDGHATLASRQIADDRLEAELISDIRSQTNLYAVPASNTGDAAGIDWVKTVVPVTVALLVVFGIGLVLMRTWHRIDPS